MTVLFDLLPAALAAGTAAAGTAATAGTAAASTAAAAGTAAASAAAAGAPLALMPAATGLFGTGITASSLISGAVTAGSVLTGLAGAMAQADGANTQAFNAKMDGLTEEAQAQQRQAQARRELARVLGETDVSYAAAGIDISAGSADAARQAAEQRFVDETMLDRSQTSARISMHNERSRLYRRMGQRALVLGAAGAALSGLGAGIR